MLILTSIPELELGKRQVAAFFHRFLANGYTTEPYEDFIPLTWSFADIEASLTDRSLARNTRVD